MRKDRGFTLAETVAVLSILTVLASVLIPSLTAYLDRARKQTALVRAQTAFLTMQYLLGVRYRVGTGFDAVEDPVELLRDRVEEDASPFALDEILRIAGLPEELPVRLFVTYDGNAALTSFRLVERFGRETVTVTWDSDGWRLAEPEAPEERNSAAAEIGD